MIREPGFRLAGGGSAAATTGPALELDLEWRAEQFLVGRLLLVGQLALDLADGLLAELDHLGPGRLAIALGLLEDGPHLLLRVLDDPVDLGLLRVGQLEMLLDVLLGERLGSLNLIMDLMEPFRPLVADSAVITAINTRMVRLNDFVLAGNSVALKPEGRKAFFRAYEQRMDSLVTHPVFGYRVNYRRVLEIQTRLLARVLTGELTTYPVFTTR